MSNRPNHKESEQEVLNEARNATYGAIDVIQQVETSAGVTAPVGYQAPLPAKIINSDGTDNSYTTGGVYGQKVHVVGISDIYAEGTIAVGSSLTGHKPLAGGFKDASGNNQFVTGDTTNGLDVDITRLPSLVAGTANIGKIIQSNVLVPADHDYIGLTYTGSNLTTATFKTGGSGGTVVATLTLAYTGSRLDSVTKT